MVHEITNFLIPYVFVVFVHKPDEKKDRFNGKFQSCCPLSFIDAKMVAIDANPMPLVHSILYIDVALGALDLH